MKKTPVFKKEFRLFHYLFENRNRVITKDELFANIWGDAFFSDGTLNVHIRKVREKIEENPNKPRFIKTIWGTGYMFETPDNWETISGKVIFLNDGTEEKALKAHLLRFLTFIFIGILTLVYIILGVCMFGY